MAVSCNGLGALLEVREFVQHGGKNALLENLHVAAHHVKMQFLVHEEEPARVLEVGHEPQFLVDQVKTLRPGLREIPAQDLKGFGICGDAGWAVIDDVGILGVDIENGTVGLVFQNALDGVDKILDRIREPEPVNEPDHKPGVLDLECLVLQACPNSLCQQRGRCRRDKEHDRGRYEPSGKLELRHDNEHEERKNEADKGIYGQFREPFSGLNHPDVPLWRRKSGNSGKTGISPGSPVL